MELNVLCTPAEADIVAPDSARLNRVAVVGSVPMWPSGAYAVKHVTEVLIEVSVGELMDKITILEIKSERILDADKQQHVCRELTMLCAVRDRTVPMVPELERCVAELRATNETLWNIEDEIRDCERRQDFGADFVELARRRVPAERPP